MVRFETPEGASVLAEAGPATFTPITTPFEKAWSVAQAFRLTPDEGIYGLGQHQDGFMNYRGRAVKLVQTNTDAVTPVVVSTRGWGLLWDNDSKTQFSDGLRARRCGRRSPTTSTTTSSWAPASTPSWAATGA